MIDLIYDFVRNVLIGSETTIQGADDLAILITFASIILIVFCLVKLIVWAFSLGSGKKRIIR